MVCLKISLLRLCHASSLLYSVAHHRFTDLIPDIYMTVEVSRGRKRPSCFSGPDHEY